jgi:RND family efflux transporter MFP subunit
VGQQARLELDALPGRSVEGRVVRISPAFDPVARTLDAEVQIQNKEGRLRPGMYGRAAIVTDVHRGALVVPASAVQISNERSFVFVLRGDKVARVAIRTGVDGGDWLEVVSGLSREDQIVTAGADVLSDGATVRAQRNVDALSGRPVQATSN